MDLTTHIAINEGPLVAVFRPLPAGSSFSFSLYFEDETAPESGVFAAKNFTGLDLVAEVRWSIFDVDAIAGGCEATVSATPGFVDFFIPATVTAGNADRVLHWGFKFLPADADQAQIVLMGDIPICYAGVR